MNPPVSPLLRNTAPEFAAPPSGMTLREILTAVFHDRRRILGTLALGLAATTAIALMMPPRYVAEASMLMRLGREYIYTPEVGDPQQPSSPVAYDREQTLAAESKIITSRDVLESVVKRLGAATIYPKLAQEPEAKRDAQAVIGLAAGLDAEMLKGSNLLQVSFKDRDPQIASKVLGAVIDAYLEKRMSVFANAAYGRAEADYVTRTIQLNTAEAKLAAYKEAHDIRSFTEEQTLLLAQRGQIEQRQNEIALALEQSGSRAGALRRSLSTVPAQVLLSTDSVRSEAVEAVRKTLLDLQLKERDLSSRYTDSNPLVRDVRADLARTEQYLAALTANPERSTKTGRSTARDAVESDLVRSLADHSQARSGMPLVGQQYERINARLEELARSEPELRSLERERRLAETNYDAAVKRLRDETMAEDLDRQRRSNVSIVQPPAVPLSQKSLVPLVVAAGTALSIVAAMLVGLISALWRDTFLSPDQLERDLDLPTLASVPRSRG